MSKVLKGGDPWMDAYIAQVRKRNADKMSRCHICKGKATTVTAIKHMVLPSCEEHIIIK
jgi:hypothetical protein